MNRRQPDRRSGIAKFHNPLDTFLSASSRFGIELVAWTAGPWAAAAIVGSWLATIPALIVLIALPGIFSTTGDKRHVVVAVPGRIRLSIEMLLLVVAIYSSFVVWTAVGGAIVSILAAVMLVTGSRRGMWLFSNRPPQWPVPSNSEQRK